MNQLSFSLLISSNNPHLPVFSCVISSDKGRLDLQILLLMSRMWQKRWGVISDCKTLWLSSCWPVSPLPSQPALWWSKLPCWQGPHGRELKPTASNELRLLVHQPARKWILPTTTWVSLEVGSSPVEPSYETSDLADIWLPPWETPSQVGCAQIPDLQKLSDKKTCVVLSH